MNRSRYLALLSGILSSTALVACSGDDTAVTAPVNDAGSDGSQTTTDGSTNPTDAGDATTPPSDGGPTTDGLTADGGATDGGPAPACSSLPGTVVYIESGDTQEPLLKALGRKLRDEANITLAFQLTGSCTLSPNLYNNVAIPTGTSMLYIPSTAENPTWTTASAESTCTTSAAVPPDLGISALYPKSCAGLSDPPAGIGSFIGPIQAYTFIVPSAEYTGGQTSISAEEAYYALGFGAQNPVTFGANPEWNDPTQFFLRPASKSTLVSTAFNIDLTAKQATDSLADGGTADGRHLEAQSSQVLAAVTAATSLNAIGILGDEIYDANRGKGVNILAFKAFGQTEAYYPDSTTSSFDKQNIRDGHYSLWSPTVYLAPIDGTGAPANPTVKYITDLVVGTAGATPPGGLLDGGTAIDGLGTIVSVGLTPDCAMQVQRATPVDGTPLSPYASSSPCTCYFLSKVANAAPLPASCVACSAAAPCATGQCFNGYCESPATPVEDAGAPGCSASDGTAAGILNACTNATFVDKQGVTLPTTDGGLLPVP